MSFFSLTFVLCDVCNILCVVPEKKTCSKSGSHLHTLMYHVFIQIIRAALLDLSVFGDDLEIPEEVTPIEGGSMPQVSSGGAGEEVGKEDDPTSRDDVILSQAMRTVDSRSRALQNLRNFTDF